ncbi:lantibiotic dehydratase [Vallicoccus soli]|uniref:Lantibiotic dehydratase N-terminal domain-containing protein n=1 Tax=Vallicoccus soli TaxID=2339232 RepID=A0A3A3Z467_9ACTN|nr:lantibiotic dehydratase [Vallicoccus soli]RJK98194.1 hypothetical protein D5H78_04655 [Vallicoccus soli]
MSAPLWFLRANPLARRRIADPALRGAVARLADAEQALAAEAGRASDALYALVGSADDDAARRRLVALRRAVRDDKAPKGEVPAVLAPWAAARAARDDARAALLAAAEGAADAERRTLAGLLGDEDLRRALALVAPEVEQGARRYREAVLAGGAVPARTRKSERGLLQYLSRALVRTSPLSRFTAVGLAVEDPAGAPLDAPSLEGATAFPGVDRVMLDHVLGGLDAPAAPEDAYVGLAPTSALDAAAGKLFFLRPTPEGLQRMAAPVTPGLRLLLDAVAMGPRPARRVAQDLAAAGGVPYEQALAHVLGSVAGGLLTASAREEDGQADLAALLDRPGDGAAAHLRAAGQLLPRLAAAPADDRPAVLADLEQALADASRAAGRPARVVVHEDYVLPPSTVATQGWEGPLDDLGAATDLLSVYDWLHDVRALMAAAFVERFGAGAVVPLAEHAPYLVGEVSRRALVMDEAFRTGGRPAGVGPADGSLEALWAVRRHVEDAVHAHLGKAAAAGDAEVVLPAQDVRELVAGVPERFRRDPLLYGVLVQPWQGRLVLNDGLPGHGMLVGRFLEADHRLGGDAVPRLAARLQEVYGAGGARVVEDLGLHGLNVNVHRRVLPDGLRPDDWYALRLRHDPATDALAVEDAEGRTLRVLPLGAGHPGLFPPPLSVATGLVISGRLYGGLASSWLRTTGWDARATTTCPRLSVGDVVVGRRRWWGGDELAGAAGAATEQERLLALTTWRARHGVPEEVVLKTTPADEGPLSVSAPDAQARRLQQKPQYLDLASTTYARVLPRLLERRGTEGQGHGYLEEATPAVGDGGHASEWVVEVGRRPGGPFRSAGGTR